MLQSFWSALGYNHSSSEKPVLIFQDTDYKSAIEKLLKKAEDYKITRVPDKQTLVEIYGFAIALTLNLSNVSEATKIRKNVELKLIQTIREFITIDLSIKNNIELDNLENYFENLKIELELIRKENRNVKEFVKKIIEYLQGIIGKPDCHYSVLCMGSLVTETTTPYSDVEYFFIVDKHNDNTTHHLQNLAILLKFIITGFGETPVYKASALLSEHEKFFLSVKKGIRIDEYKEPEDNNRLIGLIITPEELVQLLPQRIIHKPGNHLTSALLSTRFLMGDETLYLYFQKIVSAAFGSKEYLLCFNQILQEDIRACEGLLNKLKVQDLKDTVDLKKVFSHTVHLARMLALCLKSLGSELQVHSRFEDILLSLYTNKVITEPEYQNWSSLAKNLQTLRIELQKKNQSSEATITLNDLGQKIEIEEIFKTLTFIIRLSRQKVNNLDFKKHTDLDACIRRFIDVNGSVSELWPQKSLEPGFQNSFGHRGKCFQSPMSNTDFIMRPVLWDKIKNHFSSREQETLVLTAHGMGGMGKTQIAEYYFLHPPIAYNLRARFILGNKDYLCHQYVALASENGVSFQEGMSIDEKVSITKKWLESQNGFLLLYDNVPDAAVLEGILPERGNHHIFITTRNEVDWPPDQKIDIDVMEESEAIELLYKITGYKKNQENQHNLKILVKLLGRLPLALAQAGAYMSVKGVSIDSYLRRFKENQAKFLKEKTSRGPKHDAVWMTFDMNFEAIAKECPEALMTLKHASWLSHAQIPEHLLNVLMVENPNKDRDFLWDDIKENLRRYSLMRFAVEIREASIHPLLQDIVRSRQTEQEKLEIFKKVCNALDSSLILVGIISAVGLFRIASRTNIVGLSEGEEGRQSISQTESAVIEKADSDESKAINFGQQLYIMFGVQNFKGIISRFTASSLIPMFGAVSTLAAARLVTILSGNSNSLVSVSELPPSPLADMYSFSRKMYLEHKKLFSHAEKLQQHSKEFMKSKSSKEDLLLVDGPATMGVLYTFLGLTNSLINFLKEKMEYYNSDLKENNIAVINILQHLAKINLRLGKFKEAKEYFKKALEFQRQYYKEEDINRAEILGGVGFEFLGMDKLEGALAYFERNLKNIEGGSSNELSNVPLVLTALATSFTELPILGDEVSNDIDSEWVRITKSPGIFGSVNLLMSAIVQYLKTNSKQTVIENIKSSEEIYQIELSEVKLDGAIINRFFEELWCMINHQNVYESKNATPKDSVVNAELRAVPHFEISMSKLFTVRKENSRSSGGETAAPLIYSGTRNIEERRADFEPEVEGSLASNRSTQANETVAERVAALEEVQNESLKRMKEAKKMNNNK